MVAARISFPSDDRTVGARNNQAPKAVSKRTLTDAGSKRFALRKKNARYLNAPLIVISLIIIPVIKYPEMT